MVQAWDTPLGMMSNGRGLEQYSEAIQLVRRSYLQRDCRGYDNGSPSVPDILLSIRVRITVVLLKCKELVPDFQGHLIRIRFSSFLAQR
jgi:hypothetical protein